MRRACTRWLATLLTLGVLTGCGTTTVPSGSPAPGPGSGTSAGPSSPGPTTVAPTAAPTPSPTSPSAAPAPSVPPAPAPAPAPEPPVTPSSLPVCEPGDAFGTDWTVLPTTSRLVALTFDCGASDAGVAAVLSTLSDHGVRATFFVTGAFARTYPADVAAIAAAGHVIGNHSDTHDHYPAMTNAEIAADLAAARRAIAATGAEVGPWFRFPYGDRTDADVRAVNAAGYACVRWTVDTLGWQGTSGGRSAAEVVDRVLDAAEPGEIVLMHVGANPDDGSTLDADALPEVIERLREAGFGFTTVDTLCG